MPLVFLALAAWSWTCLTTKARIQKKLAACGLKLTVPDVNSLASCFLLQFSLFLPFPLLLAIASLTRSPLPSAGVGGYCYFCYCSCYCSCFCLFYCCCCCCSCCCCCCCCGGCGCGCGWGGYGCGCGCGCCCGLSVIVYTGYLFAISWRRSYPARNASPCKVSKNRKAYFIFCVFCLQRNMYSNLACILFGLLRHAQYTAQNLHGDPHEQVLDNIMWINSFKKWSVPQAPFGYGSRL